MTEDYTPDELSIKYLQQRFDTPSDAEKELYLEIVNHKYALGESREIAADTAIDVLNIKRDNQY